MKICEIDTFMKKGCQNMIDHILVNKMSLNANDCDCFYLIPKIRSFMKNLKSSDSH